MSARGFWPSNARGLRLGYRQSWTAAARRGRTCRRRAFRFLHIAPGRRKPLLQRHSSRGGHRKKRPFLGEGFESAKLVFQLEEMNYVWAGIYIYRERGKLVRVCVREKLYVYFLYIYIIFFIFVAERGENSDWAYFRNWRASI